MFALVKVKQAAAGAGRQCWSVRSRHRLRAFSTAHSSSDHEEGGNDVYDIVISGGGMVGTAMACSLGEFPQNSAFTLVPSVKYPTIALSTVCPKSLVITLSSPLHFSLTPAFLNRKCSFGVIEVFGSCSE